MVPRVTVRDVNPTRGGNVSFTLNELLPAQEYVAGGFEKVSEVGPGMGRTTVPARLAR